MMKKSFIFKAILLSIVLISLGIIALFVYLISPNQDAAEYKVRLSKLRSDYQQKEFLDLKTVQSKIKTDTSKKRFRHLNWKHRLPKECQDQILEVERIPIDEVENLFTENYRPFSKTCRQSILDEFKSPHHEVMESACRFGERLKQVISLIPDDDKDENEENQTENQLRLVDKACRAGVLAYRDQISLFLDKNLLEIDRIGEFYYLSILNATDDQEMEVNAKTRALIKLGVLEELIKETMRFVFISYMLKEIHQQNVDAESFVLNESEIYRAVIDAVYQTGK